MPLAWAWPRAERSRPVRAGPSFAALGAAPLAQRASGRRGTIWPSGGPSVTSAEPERAGPRDRTQRHPRPPTRAPAPRSAERLVPALARAADHDREHAVVRCRGTRPTAPARSRSPAGPAARPGSRRGHRWCCGPRPRGRSARRPAPRSRRAPRGPGSRRRSARPPRRRSARPRRRSGHRPRRPTFANWTAMTSGVPRRCWMSKNPLRIVLVQPSSTAERDRRAEPRVPCRCLRPSPRTAARRDRTQTAGTGGRGGSDGMTVSVGEAVPGSTAPGRRAAALAGSRDRQRWRAARARGDDQRCQRRRSAAAGIDQGCAWALLARPRWGATRLLARTA